MVSKNTSQQRLADLLLNVHARWARGLTSFSLGFLLVFACGQPGALRAEEDTERPAAEATPAPKPVDGLDEWLALDKRIRELLPAARAATVALESRFGAGSGVIVNDEGLILTAGHVSGNPGRTMEVIFEDGRRVEGTTLGYSAFTDAGMVKINTPGPYPFAPLAPLLSAQKGNWSFALGHPGGFDEDRGVVLRIGKIIDRSTSTLRSDCKLLGGDSGGPLFNLDGEIVGIHSRISMEVDQNFHAPADAFHRAWDDMLAGREIRRRGAFLGISMESASNGVLIQGVVDGSAASRAQLRTGDIITHIDDIMVLDPPDLTMMIGGKTEDETVKITYERASEPGHVIIRLGQWPGWNGDAAPSSEDDEEDPE